MSGERVGAHGVAVVTGGTGGLGQAVVLRLLAGGWRVAVPFAVEEEKGTLEQRVIESGFRDRATFGRADLSRPGEVAAFFASVEERFGGVQALVNGLGGFSMAPLSETAPEEWERLFALNASSAFLCSRSAIPLLQRGGGTIVNVGAHPALGRGTAGMAAYGASKAALLHLTTALSLELLDSGITVNAIVPGTIDTPANRAAMPGSDRSGWLDPDDIARVVDFLLSPEARIVTGSFLTLSASGRRPPS